MEATTQTARKRAPWGKRALIAGALVGGWFAIDLIALAYEVEPTAVTASAVVLVVGAYAFYRWAERRQFRTWVERRNGWRSIDLFHPFMIGLVVVLWGLGQGRAARDHVETYCRYGVQSQAQLEGCKAHVRRSYVEKLDTQAARFARGETSACLADAGPFCEAAARWNTADPPNFPYE